MHREGVESPAEVERLVKYSARERSAELTRGARGHVDCLLFQIRVTHIWRIRAIPKEKVMEKNTSMRISRPLNDAKKMNVVNPAGKVDPTYHVPSKALGIK